MFWLAKSRNIVAMKDVALLYTSRPDSPSGNLCRHFFGGEGGMLI